LCVTAPEALQLARLHLVLNALSDHVGLKRLRKGENALDDGGTVVEEKSCTNERSI